MAPGPTARQHSPTRVRQLLVHHTVILQKNHSSITNLIKYQLRLFWKAHCLKLDCTHSNAITTLFICTDFGARLDLESIEKNNCAPVNHAAFCVMHAMRYWEECGHEDFYYGNNRPTKKKLVNKCNR